jgi:hypothetical protein
VDERNVLTSNLSGSKTYLCALHKHKQKSWRELRRQPPRSTLHIMKGKKSQDLNPCFENKTRAAVLIIMLIRAQTPPQCKKSKSSTSELPGPFSLICSRLFVYSHQPPKSFLLPRARRAKGLNPTDLRLFADVACGTHFFAIDCCFSTFLWRAPGEFHYTRAWYYCYYNSAPGTKKVTASINCADSIPIALICIEEFLFLR